MQEEIWKPIQGFENYYQVSNLGNVRSLPRRRKVKNNYRYTEGIMLKPMQKPDYYAVGLSLKGSIKYARIHRLVAQAFIGNPDNKLYVNHIDGNKLNNNASNLEWCTPKENTDHYINSCKEYNGNNNFGIKLKADQVIAIYNSRESHTVLSEKYNVSTKAISNIRTGRTWSDITNHKRAKNG